MHSTRTHRTQAQHGFTLLELIVVLLILGVLAAIATPTFNIITTASARSSVETTANAIARDANAIAASDPTAGGAVTDQTLTRASEETIEFGPIASSGELTVSTTTGNTTCQAIIAVINSKAQAGPGACGDEPLLYPEGYIAGQTNGRGTLTIDYTATMFNAADGPGNSLTPTITGGTQRTETLGTGCLFFPSDFYTAAAWADYGLAPADCGLQGGAWRTNYSRAVPDVTVSIAAGALPPGFTLDPSTGTISAPISWAEAAAHIPFTVTLIATDSNSQSAQSTVTFVAG